jgi:hypothetical protein
MPKITIPEHPIHDIRCKDCRFWHTYLAKTYYVHPQTGQAFTKEQLGGDLQKSATWPAQRMSLCFLNPKWEMTDETSYCSHWASGT